jgi:hypothetical protein
MDDIGGTVLPMSENLLAGDNAALPKRRVLQNRFQKTWDFVV